MDDQNQKTGRWGENVACDYLERSGYSVLARNQRTPHGEIDIIASQNISNPQGFSNGISDQEEMIVFVEVKTRTSRRFGLPEDAITPEKQAHMLDSALFYLQENSKLGDTWRIDVISVEIRSTETLPQITHFEDALSG